MIFQNFGFNRLKVKIISTPGYDPDAQAFINATGISGTTADAINQLVLDLKSYSLWTKMTAIYPLVGGSSASTSYNLVNTSTYQITWNGTLTFASTGVAGNGTNGWGNTGLNPYVAPGNIYSSGATISTYVRTNGNAGAYDMGANTYPAQSAAPEWMIARYTNDRYTAFGAVAPGDPYVFVSDAGLTKTQFFAGTSDGTTTRLYSNSTNIASATKTYGIVDNTIALCALNRPSNAASDFSSREYAWFSIGLYLTSTEISNLNTCVTTFETSLGRNV
jgi:hypothetical protein